MCEGKGEQGRGAERPIYLLSCLISGGVGVYDRGPITVD